MVTKKCLEILSSGGIIIYPTDTVYGIGCDATNLNSILKINEIKNRESNTPLICLMNGIEMVKNYVTNLSDISKKYLLDSDEPTTVIFKKSKNLDSYPGSIAVRIPKNKICLQLISKLKRPITSTSANFSGKKIPKYFNEIDKDLLRLVDYSINFDKNQQNKASRIVIIDKMSNVKVIRS
ncbi:MAG: threonylcarbamoyl-AMP synthase [Flavobacteriaceae bacterium]|nr:threonylcarbamoyl-AMP synthase [Flavobacteriaceae bacterium]